MMSMAKTGCFAARADLYRLLRVAVEDGWAFGSTHVPYLGRRIVGSLVDLRLVR